MSRSSRLGQILFAFAALPAMVAHGADAPTAAAVAPTATPAAPIAPTAPLLSLPAAIAKARATHPDVRAERARVQGAEAREDGVHATLHPTVDLSGAVGLGATNPPGLDDVNGQASLGLRASWLLTDFGQSQANVDAAHAATVAEQANLTGSDLDVIQAVSLAYYDAVGKRALRQVAEETRVAEARHLDQARRFVAAGARDPIEVTRAEAQLATANAAYVRADGAYQLALVTLAQAMGASASPGSFEVAEVWASAVAGEDGGVDALTDEATQRSPELMQSQAALEASQARGRAADRGDRPSLSVGASTGVNWNGDWDPSEAWALTLNLSWRVFDFGRVRAATRAASADEQVALATLDGQRLSLRASVAGAVTEVVSTRAELDAAVIATAASRKTLAQAEARYAQGAGSEIEVQDAVTAVSTSAGAEVSARDRLSQARVKLERALGRVDIPTAS